MGCCGGGGDFKPDNEVKNSNVEKTETRKEQSGSLISIVMVILVIIAVAFLANRFFI